MSDHPKPPTLAYQTPGKERRPTAPAASTSFGLGLIGFIPLLFIPGIITGVKGIKATRDPAFRGRGLAIAGLVLGILWGLLNIAAVPAVIRARQAAQQTACLSNLRQLGMVLMIYANANAGDLPPDLITAATFTKVNTPAVFICPASDDTPTPNMASLNAGPHVSYTYVGAGQKLTRLRPASATVLLIETGDNHRNGQVCVLFADGHCEVVDKTTAAQIRADIAAGKVPPVVPQPWLTAPTTAPTTGP